MKNPSKRANIYIMSCVQAMYYARACVACMRRLCRTDNKHKKVILFKIIQTIMRLKADGSREKNK